MHVRLLGTAAGGGVPQWNCNCAICREARAGTGRVRPRTQSCVAVSADGRSWFLLNASPDLRAQFESAKWLHPPNNMQRGTRIEGVLLTNADLDHTLGLFSLREGEKLRIYATPRVRRFLAAGLCLPLTLERFCGVEWIPPPKKAAPLLGRNGSRSGLLFELVALDGKQPRFVKGRLRSTAGNVVGYRLIDERTGGKLLFLPDVATMNRKLNALLRDCDVLLFDGTFWSEQEMRKQGVGFHSAASMGHIPISGLQGSLKVLASLRTKHKIYIHINNTNPMLFEDSPERAAVVSGGCMVGYDGMEILV